MCVSMKEPSEGRCLSEQFICTHLHFRKESNIIEAISNGAVVSVKIVVNIVVNIIAFVALLEFVNQTLTWFGNRLGKTDPPITFEVRRHVAQNIATKLHSRILNRNI